MRHKFILDLVGVLFFLAMVLVLPFLAWILHRRQRGRR